MDIEDKPIDTFAETGIQVADGSHFKFDIIVVTAGFVSRLPTFLFSLPLVLISI